MRLLLVHITPTRRHRVIAFALAVALLIIAPGMVRAGLTPEELKGINERRADAQKRHAAVQKEETKRRQDQQQRYQTLHKEQVKKDQQTKVHQTELKKMRDVRIGERLKRLETNRSDREKRRLESRKANRDRLFRR